jgi:lysophospholipase L1-like esterase
VSVIQISAQDRRRIKLAGQILGGVTGTAAALTAFSFGLLYRQAADARRIIPMAEAPPPRGDGMYGAKFGGKPISMVILGDSSAAGYGVHRPRETPGALLATGVSRRLNRPVRLRRVAVVGSMSSGLPYQVDAALEYAPDVAIILIGANDVTHVSARPTAVRHLGDAVRRLRATGCKVVVGTCPDIGAIQPIKPPLRWLAAKWSRDLAAEQTVAVVEAGGRTVSLGNLLGPMFAADPVRMFSSDHFHPSAEGYARAAAVVLPTLLAALNEPSLSEPGLNEAGLGKAGLGESGLGESGLGEPGLAAFGPDRPAAGDVLSLPEAAQEAVRAAGTEVSPARGPAGRWAVLRRHPWFGEPRHWFGHHKEAVAGDSAPVPSGRSASSAVGWMPEDH